MEGDVAGIDGAAHTSEQTVLGIKDNDLAPSSLHRPKESETDEIFVEALEGSIEDSISLSNGLNPRSDSAAGVSCDTDKASDSDSNLQHGEGSLPARDQDEIKEAVNEIPDDVRNPRNLNAPSDDDDVINGSVPYLYVKGGTESERYDSKDSDADVIDYRNTDHSKNPVSDASFLLENGSGSDKATEVNNHHETAHNAQSVNVNPDEIEVKSRYAKDDERDRDGVPNEAIEVNEKSADEAIAAVSSEDQNGLREDYKDACTGEETYLKDVNSTSGGEQGVSNAGLDVSSNSEAHSSKNGQLEQAPLTASTEQREVDDEANSGEGSTSAKTAALTSNAKQPSLYETSSVVNIEKDEIIASDLGKELRQHAMYNDEKCSANGLKEEDVKKEVHIPDQDNQPSIEGPASSVGLTEAKTADPVQSSARPAGLGRAAPLLQPTARAVQQVRPNGAVSAQSQSQIAEETGRGEIEEVDETREKLQMIRVKFLRLAHRLGQTPHNVVVAQVLYRLGLAEQLRGRTGGRVGAFSFDRAASIAEKLEQSGQEPLDFSCTIMVLGKSGVGKSATINSIFDEVMFNTDAFDSGTKKVQDVVGTVQGIRVRVIDTPGLLPSWSDQRKNEKTLHSIKQFIKKSQPDIVLYLDRLDMPNRDLGDTPLLRTITDVFGPSIWFNAIVVLTHAASAPPEGPNGTASTYDMFVTQRSHAVQQAIRQAAGDIRLMNPVSLVENHSACRTNRAGQRVLPNGQVWKPHLLLLSFASKILAEANTLLKLQETPSGKSSNARSRSPPLPYLLSSLLQSRPQLKLPEEQLDDEDDAVDDDMDESSDSDGESEYDELPPFRSLTRAQLGKLTKEQRNAYYDELEYRERLLMERQLKQEKRRRKMMKKMAEAAKDMPSGEIGENGENGGNMEEDNNGAASLPVPMPDLPLPASFDADNPTHRYRHLDTSKWIVRPIPDANGWDHDVGYDLMMVERMFVIKEKIPLSLSGQISKDKKEANLQMELSSSLKHGEGKATNLGLDMQSVGRDMAYTLRSETRFSSRKHNKATAALSMTMLGDSVTAGMKVEDKFIANKQFRCVISGGAMMGRGDVAYGGSLEATLRGKDPLGRFLSSLGLSIMDWHGDLAIGCNLQSQIPVGRFSNLIARANLNNRGSGQVSIRLNSSEQIQIALLGLIPLVKKLIGQSQQYPYSH